MTRETCCVHFYPGQGRQEPARLTWKWNGVNYKSEDPDFASQPSVIRGHLVLCRALVFILKTGIRALAITPLVE